MRYLERLIEQEINKNRRNWPDGANIRRDLYTDNFHEIIKELQKTYSIVRYAIELYDEYKYIIDDTIELVINLDNRNTMKNNYEDNCYVVLLRMIDVKESKRNQGIGSEFMRDLIARSEELYPKMSYLLFPYHEKYSDEELIRLGRWYISLGFFPLYGELLYEETKRPYIKHNLSEVYKRGIRGIGYGAKMEPFKASPEDFTDLQKKYGFKTPEQIE